MNSSTDDDGLAVVRNQVKAAEAPPVETTAPNSVFALGAQASPAAATTTADPADDGAGPREARALRLIEQRGEVTVLQLAEALGVSRATTNNLITALRKAGRIHMRAEGVQRYYSLAAATGFKGWLQRKGQVSAEGRAKPKRGRPPKARPPAVSTVITPAAQAPASPAGDIEFGLFNSGCVSIEADGQLMRLDRVRARKLIDWLLQVDQVLRVTAPGRP